MANLSAEVIIIWRSRCEKSDVKVILAEARGVAILVLILKVIFPFRYYFILNLLIFLFC